MIRKQLPFLFLIAALLTAPALKGQEHKTTKGGFYFETLLGISSYGSSEVSVSERGENSFLSESGFAYGLKLGNKFYFGDDSKDFRLGMDVNWFGVHGIQVSVEDEIGSESFSYNALNFSFVNPGIGMAMKLNENMGIDANVNFGPNIMIGYSSDLDDGGAGFGLKVGPQVKWHYSILAVGFEYRYCSVLSEESTIETLRTNVYGMTIGLKL